jgi:hypothetical protein
MARRREQVEQVRTRGVDVPQASATKRVKSTDVAGSEYNCSLLSHERCRFGRERRSAQAPMCTMPYNAESRGECNRSQMEAMEATNAIAGS